jgi:hypothetical protein
VWSFAAKQHIHSDVFRRAFAPGAPGGEAGEEADALETSSFTERSVRALSRARSAQYGDKARLEQASKYRRDSRQEDRRVAGVRAGEAGWLCRRLRLTGAAEAVDVGAKKI